MIDGVKFTFFARTGVAFSYFDTLPRVTGAGIQKIEQGSSAQIDDWFDRAVDASNLENVFAADDGHH